MEIRYKISDEKKFAWARFFLHVIWERNHLTERWRDQALGMHEVRRNRAVVFVDSSNLVSCTSFCLKCCRRLESAMLELIKTGEKKSVCHLNHKFSCGTIAVVSWWQPKSVFFSLSTFFFIRLHATEQKPSKKSTGYINYHNSDFVATKLELCLTSCWVNFQFWFKLCRFNGIIDNIQKGFASKY